MSGTGPSAHPVGSVPCFQERAHAVVPQRRLHTTPVASGSAKERLRTGGTQRVRCVTGDALYGVVWYGAV